MFFTGNGQDVLTKQARKLIAATALATLTACGGGGGGGGNAAETSNDARAIDIQPVVGPSDLAYQLTHSNTLALSWKDNTNDELAYSVYRKAEDQNNFSRIAYLNSNSTSWEDTTVESGKRYSYYVLANRSDANLISNTIVTDAVQSTVSTTSASIVLPAGMSGDGENQNANPNVRQDDNDSIYGAYSVPNLNGKKSTIVGAVSHYSDDQNDFFQTTLDAGSIIELRSIGAKSDGSDADLYLYDEQLNLIDASLNNDANETINAPATGNYYVEVAHRSGDTIKYTLDFSDADISTSSNGFNISGNVIIGEFILSSQSIGVLDSITSLGNILSGSLNGASLLSVNNPEFLLNSVLVGFHKARDYQQRRQLIRDAARRATYDSLTFARALQNMLGGFVEPNLELSTAGLSTNDSAAAYQWAPEQIGVENAWATTSGADHVNVAVIDTGFLVNHPDLEGAFVDGWNFVDDNNNPAATPQLSLQHGTHVAGIIAARKDNGRDIAGIAPNVKVMPIKIMKPSCVCGSLYDAMQGILWAAGLDNSAGTKAEKPAKVINLSIDLPKSHSNVLADTVSAAANAGSVVVWAAGNNSSRINVTEEHSLKTPGLVVVSASGLYGKMASYSNYGSAIDLIAPGGDSDTNNGSQRIRSLNGRINSDGSGSYGASNMQGTSQAAPHVAGVFALMASIWPNFNPTSVESLLEAELLTQDTGVNGRDDYHGFGRIDAQRAVESAANAASNSGNLPHNSTLRLTANPGELNFGGSFTQLAANIEANQNGISPLQVSYTPNWVSLRAVDTDASGLGDWLVTIDREQLSSERYESVVILESEGRRLYLPVSAYGEGYLAQGTGVGKMLVEFLNPQTKRREHFVQAEVDSSDRFSYNTANVSAGDYIIRASSDLDNNGVFCETGEFCGYIKDDPEETTRIDDASSLNGSMINLELL